MERDPVSVLACVMCNTLRPVCECECVLGELEACVHADGVAELVSEYALLAVVGQFEQVEAGGRGGQATPRLLLTNSEEAPQHAAQGVPRVLHAVTRTQ